MASRSTHVGAVAVTLGWLACSAPNGAPAAPAGDVDAVDASTAAVDASTAPTAAQDSGDAADARSDDPKCIAYCEMVLRGCLPDYVQFGSKTECLQACSYYPPGSPGDITGNSLECRMAHGADAAGGDPQAHCLHAGPFGYGGCGEMCEAFCQIVMPWCGSLAPFASNDACMSECLAWKWAPSMPDGGAAYRASGPTSGDTLDCREVMLVKSLDGPAAREQYCPLTATNSATCR